MLCPHCTRPYYFLDPFDAQRCRCRLCGAEGPFVPLIANEAAANPSDYRRDEETDPLLHELMQTLRITRDDVVLELGSGNGDVAATISQYSTHVTGLATDVAEARRRHPSVQFLTYAADRPLPLADSSVDVLISLHFIEHVQNADTVLRECQRVLRPQGRVALVTANLDYALHRRLFDASNLHEWSLAEFSINSGRFFVPAFVEKSSSLFQIHPLNKLLKHVLKPDLVFVGLKPND